MIILIIPWLLLVDQQYIAYCKVIIHIFFDNMHDNLCTFKRCDGTGCGILANMLWTACLILQHLEKKNLSPNHIVSLLFAKNKYLSQILIFKTSYMPIMQHWLLHLTLSHLSPFWYMLVVLSDDDDCQNVYYLMIEKLSTVE